jgi:hypothetical protein
VRAPRRRRRAVAPRHALGRVTASYPARVAARGLSPAHRLVLDAVRPGARARSTSAARPDTSRSGSPPAAASWSAWRPIRRRPRRRRRGRVRACPDRRRRGGRVPRRAPCACAVRRSCAATSSSTCAIRGTRSPSSRRCSRRPATPGSPSRTPRTARRAGRSSAGASRTPSTACSTARTCASSRWRARGRSCRAAGRARRRAGAQRPFQTGSRFSLNAVAPSRASSEANTGSEIFDCSSQNSASLQSRWR